MQQTRPRPAAGRALLSVDSWSRQPRKAGPPGPPERGQDLPKAALEPRRSRNCAPASWSGRASAPAGGERAAGVGARVHLTGSGAREVPCCGFATEFRVEGISPGSPSYPGAQALGMKSLPLSLVGHSRYHAALRLLPLQLRAD